MSHMTDAQIVTLRNYCLNNATPAALLSAGNVIGLLSWCNADSGQRRWLPSADTLSIEEAPSYTTYDSLVQGKRDSWILFLKNPRDFGRNKVRNWVVDIWGAATAASNTEAILLAGSKVASNAQIALGGTSKATGTVTAIDTLFEEDVDINDVTKVIFKDDGTIWTL